MARDGAQSRLLLNLGLLALVAVLGVFAYWASNRGDETETARVTEHSAATIEHIVIHRAEGPDIELSRSGERWHLDAPFDMPASTYRSAQVAGLLEETSHARYDATELDLERYGLQPSKATVSLDQTVIELGDVNPVNSYRYVLVDGQVHLVSDTLYDALEGDPTSFIDTQLLPEDAQIEHIQLPETRLSKVPDGGWTIEPEQPELSADDIQRLVDEWRRTNALWVKPYDESPATARVVIRLVEGDELEFIVTRTEPDLVLARPKLGIQYRLVADKAEALLQLRPEPAKEQGPSPDSSPGGGRLLGQ